MRTKHRVIGQHVGVFFISEFVEHERVFVVCLGLQFQQRLGGVFHERFVSLVAVVGETVFVSAVKVLCVCPPVIVGRTPQIDCVRARCASLEVDEAHQLSREAWQKHVFSKIGFNYTSTRFSTAGVWKLFSNLLFNRIRPSLCLRAFRVFAPHHQSHPELHSFLCNHLRLLLLNRCF